MSTKFRFILASFAASALILSGCAAEPEDAPSDATAEAPMEAAPTEQEEAEAEEPEAEPEPEAATQEKTCDWDTDALRPGSTGEVPTSADGDINTAITGAWQHTHIDEGDGFYEVGEGTDIRFVFPSPTEFLYCQDIAGVLEERQIEATIVIENNGFGRPDSEQLYVAQAWSDDTLVLTNMLDQSLYLLQRR